MARSDSPSDAHSPIAAYARAQSPEPRAICEKLRVEIDRVLPAATSKIWHGSPVWFLGENPVVGYSVRQKRVDLMFWSGQLFDDPRLKALGKDKAAQVSIQDESSINLPELRRWLKKAGTIVFDYAGVYRQKRETAGTKSQKRA
jgi:hypothetical protein